MRKLQNIVGGNIRQQRLARGLSQQVLAERADLSRRMITLIENGDGNASLATLDRLAAALHVDFATLIAPQGNHKQGAAKPIQVWQGRDRRSHARLLQSCTLPSPVELWTWQLAPGERYDAEPDPAGMREIILVIAGRLDLELSAAKHRLSSGQSIDFASDQPYAYANNGKVVLKFIKNVLR
jgi:transcriptional regulator with XRE-family HTH domain